MYYINEKDEIDGKKHNKTSENAIKKIKTEKQDNIFHSILFCFGKRKETSQQLYDMSS